MDAGVAVVVSLVVILVITGLVMLVRRVYASPGQRYRRELRGIRRIRQGIRGGDPHATQIDPTPGTFSADI
jgi:hypothetical protein